VLNAGYVVQDGELLAGLDELEGVTTETSLATR
jgi:hypothetical protein